LLVKFAEWTDLTNESQEIGVAPQSVAGILISKQRTAKTAKKTKTKRKKLLVLVF
jgi:hypothetical protein